MSIYEKKDSVFGATLLIVGWALADGFLRIPIVAGTSGFLPAFSISFFVYLYMIAASLLYLEAILAFPDGAHLISICKKLIGKVGTALIAILFVGLMYSYLGSYFHDFGDSLSLSVFHGFGITIPSKIAICGLAIVLFIVVTLGAWITSMVNLALCCGLVGATASLFFTRFSEISLEYLSKHHWGFVFFAIPTTVGAYYFQGLLPSISTYLKRDTRRLIKTIILSLTLIFVWLTAWQLLTLGSIPTALLWKVMNSHTATAPGIQLFLGEPKVIIAFRFVIFFTLITSTLLGVFILVDFFSDGLKISVEKRRGFRRIWLTAAVIIPAVIVGFWSWRLVENFVTSWVELVLVGLLPTCLVWQVRYTHMLSAPKIFPGGRIALIVFGVISFLLFYFQAGNLFWSYSL